MILEQDIRSAILALMQTKWPEGKGKFRYYMREVRDAYVMPCFFILIDLNNEEPSGAVTVRKEYTVRIQFYEEEHAEKHTVVIMNGLRELFLSSGKSKRIPLLLVKDRCLEIRKLSYSYVGSYMDIPEISFDLNFFDSYAVPDTHETMNDIHIKEEIKEV